MHIRKEPKKLFAIFRLVLGSLFLVIFIILIKKSQTTHKRRWLITSVVVTIILTTVFSFIPIENAFVTFSSPQSSYSYNHPGDVKLIVNGEETDFIVGFKDDTEIYAIVPKSDDGWKLGTGLDTKRIAQTTVDGILVCVYQYKNLDDYYITVFDTNGGSSEITDNHSTRFQFLDEANRVLNKTFYTYYAYIHDYDDQYVLSVNGKTIEI